MEISSDTVPTAWRGCLAAYLAAKRQHGTSERAFHLSQRTFRRLAEHMDDERAYFIAGCNMADRANLKAYAAMRAAFERLIQSLEGAPVQDRISALSAIRATALRTPANSNRPQHLTSRKSCPHAKPKAKAAAN